jgi:hypothetical protein
MSGLLYDVLVIAVTVVSFAVLITFSVGCEKL